MSEAERVLAEGVWALLADAESIDRAEDARWGKNRCGDESPEQLRRRATRLAKICEGKGGLQAEAGQRVKPRTAPKPKAQRALVGALLLALTCAGGYAVAVHKTVTLFGRWLTDDGVDDEVTRDRRRAGQRLRRR